MTWYLVKTNPKCERKAACWLRRIGVRVYMPKRLVSRGKPGEPAKCRPNFIGYLLVRFTEAVSDHGVPRFDKARECFGVREFVEWRNRDGVVRPVPLPDAEVARYMRRERLGDYDGAKQAKAEREARRARMQRGMQVRIVEGPFASFLARVERIDGDGAKLLVDIFGRETPVTLDHFEDQVEPVAKLLKAA